LLRHLTCRAHDLGHELRGRFGLQVDHATLEVLEGLLAGKLHEPLGNQSLEPDLLEVLLVDPRPCDSTQLVALLGLRSEPAREPVEEIVTPSHATRQHECEHDENGDHGKNRFLVPPENIERIVSHSHSSVYVGGSGVAKRLRGLTAGISLY
jgi:hypothetical protein